MPTSTAPERCDRIAGEAADDGADKGLQPDHEAGIVIDRRGRADQDGGDAGKQRSDEIGNGAGAGRPDADQPRADAVDGGRAQRPARHRAFEEQEEQQAEQGGGNHHQQHLRRDDDAAAEHVDAVDHRANTKAFGAEEHQPQPTQREMQRQRDDQQHQHRGVRRGPERDAVEQRRDRQHQRYRQHDLHRVGQGMRGGEPGQRAGDQRQQAIEQQRSRNPRSFAGTDMPGHIDDGCDGGQDRDHPDRAGRPAQFERGDREHAERGDVAERHEHHAGDRKDQHEAEPRQQIDRSVGDAIEQQNDGDFSRHGDPAPLA